MKNITLLFILMLSFSVFSQRTLWEEDFESDTIPTDWTTWNGGGGSGTTDWTFGTGEFPWSDYDSWDLDNKAAIFSDFTPDEDSHNIRILARTEEGTDATGFTNLKLEFECSLRVSGSYGGGKLYVLVRDESANTWRYIASYTNDILSATIQLDLEAFMNTYPGIDRSNIKVGFMYDDLGKGITYGAGIGWVKITADPPENDTCINATHVELPFYENKAFLWGTTNNGGIDACESNHPDGIWFTFTPEYSWKIRIGIFPLLSPNVEVYTGSCNNLTCVSIEKSQGINIYDTYYSFDAVAGTQYWVNINKDGMTDYSQFTKNFSISIKYKAPSNDSCYGATSINLPYTNTQSFDGTTNNDGFITLCNPGMNDGVWYKFYARATAEVILKAQAPQVDLEIGFYKVNDPAHSCSSLSCAGSADSFGTGSEETLVANVVAGNWYYINIGHYSSTDDIQEQGDMTFSMYYRAPENDLCSNAVELTCGIQVHGTTAGATNDNANLCNIQQTDIGVWYHFISEFGGIVNVEVTGISNQNQIKNLSVFTGNCGNLNCQFNNEDVTPYVEFQTQIGADYYFYISTAVDEVTDFNINVNCVAPDNDEAAGAYEINVNPAGTTCTNPTIVWNANGVTDSSPINGTPSCGNYAGGDSWYKFISPASGGIKINRPNKGDWGYLSFAIYDNPTSTTPIVCSSISDASTESNDITGLTAGNYYWLRIWEWNNNDYGSVGICLEEVYTSGIEDLEKFGFTYYPNPAKNLITVSAEEKINQIDIYNITGQLILSKTISNTQSTIDISNLRKGTYFIKVQIGTLNGTFKLIKL